MRLHLKISLLVAAVALAVALGSFLTMGPVVRRALRRETQEKAQLVAVLLAGRVTGPMLEGNRLAVREALQNTVKGTRGVVYAYVVGFGNEIAAHSFDGGFPRALLPSGPQRASAAAPEVAEYRMNGDPVIDVGYPLVERMAAHVHVGLSEHDTYANLELLRRRLLAQAAGLAALAVFVGIVLSLRVARPLEKLADAMKRFGEGKEDVEPPASSGGREVRELARAFGQMTEARRRAEELLASEREQLAVTLRSIGDAVIAADAAGRVVLVNRVAEELTGWTSAEAIGQPLTRVFNIISEKTREPCENPVEKVLQTGSIVGLANHTALIARDGSERSIADSAAPIRDQKNVVRGVVLVFRDVSQEKIVQEELLRAEKLRSLGILAGGIAHDFNNILTVITGHLSLAGIRATADQRLCDHLQAIDKAAFRARDLTQQLLTFAKGGTPVRRACSLCDLLRDSAQFALRGANVELRLERPEDVWPAEIDEGQISQVLQNLVINADQAMPDGGRITIRCENACVPDDGALPLRGGRYVRIAVEDEGGGIPASVLPRIFDPFFTTKPSGSGLGLATAYSVVRNHNGHIAVESQTGAGTKFHVYLPATDKAVESGPEAAEPVGSPAGRVLLMDDEETIREVGGQMLEHLGYRVSRAANGKEALAEYEEAKRNGLPFRAVVLDLTIPGGMGGIEVLRRLREIDAGVKAIVSSGYSNNPAMADYRSHGFHGVVAKPYRLKELSRTLNRVLEEDVQG